MITIFKRFWERYYIEIIVSILGLISAIVTAVVESNFSYNQVVIILITIAIDTICLSNKSLLSENRENMKSDLNILVSLNELYQFYEKMSDEWKKIARKKIYKLRSELKEMSEGVLILSGDLLIKYQAIILRNANRRVYAIHQAMDEKSLRRWDKKQSTKDFTTILIKANKEIKFLVDKKRIFIIDEELLKNGEMQKLLKKIVREQRFNMHFKIRIITKQSCEESEMDIPKDLLICDDEVVEVHFYDGKAQGEISKHKDTVERQEEYFGDYWEMGQKKCLFNRE